MKWLKWQAQNIFYNDGTIVKFWPWIMNRDYLLPTNNEKLQEKLIGMNGVKQKKDKAIYVHLIKKQLPHR